jgi:hypothetical protein
MFETAEIGNRVGKRPIEHEASKVRTKLLAVRDELPGVTREKNWEANERLAKDSIREPCRERLRQLFAGLPGSAGSTPGRPRRHTVARLGARNPAAERTGSCRTGVRFAGCG